MTENSSTAKVLCVDDEQDILDSLERTLRRRFQVLTAKSFDEALQKVEDHPDISVVISDFMLGLETGTSLLTQIRSEIPNASRVLLSGQVDLKSLEDAINSNKIHKFILKPWENDQLLDRKSVV